MKTETSIPITTEQQFFQFLVNQKQGTLEELNMQFPPSELVRESQYIYQFRLLKYIRIREGAAIIDPFSFLRFFDSPIVYLIQYFESRRFLNLPEGSWMLTYEGKKVWNSFYREPTFFVTLSRYYSYYVLGV